jgi:hypothetical protein
MLQNYKEQKRIIQQKHIEILQKKKDEASLMKQRKNNEIIKIKQDIDTYGGQFLLSVMICLLLYYMHHFLEHFHLKLQY